MNRPLIYPMRIALAFVSGLACLLSQPAVWAQSPFITAPPDQDPMIRAVIEVQDRHTDRLLRIPGVVGTATTILPDGGYAVKVLTQFLGVERALPEFLEDMPVVAEEVGDIRALQFTGKYDPVPPGVSTGNWKECAAGTIGAVVTKNGVPHFLSNNHVLARSNKAVTGEDIGQPGRYDSIPQCDTGFPNIVADLSQFKKITFGFFGNNRIDAAIAQIRNGIGYSCATACGYTPSSAPVTASLGMGVKKCGRTTELTTGTVNGVNVTVLVSYGLGKYARYTGQIQTTPMSASGDSGSVMVTNDDTFNPVALLFAGSAQTTIGNPIVEVLNNFGASICDS